MERPMDVDEIRTLYSFNRWATSRVIDAARLLSPEDFVKEGIRIETFVLKDAVRWIR
jgi:uncharacterized damage-inducible protein DinB